MEDEVWRPVDHKRVADGYEVSNYGRMRGPSGELLEPLNHGHQGNLVHYHPQRKYPMTHIDVQAGRAVLEAFVGQAPPGAYCGYKDGNRHNLHVDNLEWRFDVAPQGEDHGQSKLTADQVRDIRAYPTYRGAQKELAEKYGVSVALVSAIILRKVWRHLD